MSERRVDPKHFQTAVLPPTPSSAGSKVYVWNCWHCGQEWPCHPGELCPECRAKEETDRKTLEYATARLEILEARLDEFYPQAVRVQARQHHQHLERLGLQPQPITQEVTYLCWQDRVVPLLGVFLERRHPDLEEAWWNQIFAAAARHLPRQT